MYHFYINLEFIFETKFNAILYFIVVLNKICGANYKNIIIKRFIKSKL